MEVAPRDSDLPEAVIKSDATTWAYSAPGREAPYAYVVDSEVQPFHGHTPTSSPAQRSRWTRWPFLLLYGLLIAILAGVGGGFIGERLTINDYEKDYVPIAQMSARCTTTSTSTPNPSPSVPLSSSSSATPTSTPSATVFERRLPVPTTGCPSITTQSSFKAFTFFLDAPYTTFCATGWLNDELFAVSAATPSDCVEACVWYNSYRTSGERQCYGAGFIPAWWNQTKAMNESGRLPYNCFLKSGDRSVGRNDRDIEVVALCMDGACKGVLG